MRENAVRLAAQHRTHVIMPVFWNHEQAPSLQPAEKHGATHSWESNGRVQLSKYSATCQKQALKWQ